MTYENGAMLSGCSRAALVFTYCPDKLTTVSPFDLQSALVWMITSVAILFLEVNGMGTAWEESLGATVKGQGWFLASLFVQKRCWGHQLRY
jgi:hypothetical protein